MKLMRIFASAATVLLLVGCGNSYHVDTEHEGATNCSIYQLDNGDTLLTCADGSETIISGGIEGKSGKTGESCSAIASDNGVSLQCPGQDPIVIPKTDGKPGESCTATSVDDGIRLTCPGQDSVFIPSTGMEPGILCEFETLPGGVQLRCGDGEEIILLTNNFCGFREESNGDQVIRCGSSTHTIDADCSDGFPFDLYVTVGGDSENSDVSTGLNMLPVLAKTNCTVLQGELFVQTPYSETSDLQWPDILERITHIQGSLSIQNYTEGELIPSLPALTQVDGSVDVYGTGNAETVGDFHALTTVGGDFNISPQSDEDGNPAPIRADDFPTLSSIGSLTVQYAASVTLPALKTLERLGIFYINGFTTLSLPELTTTDTIEISFNPDLTSISMPKLTTVLDTLSIGANGALTSIDMPLLTTIHGEFTDSDHNVITTGTLRIENNAGLETISFPALTTVSNHLSIVENALLASIDLSLLTDVNEMYINNNESLPQCDVEDLFAIVQPTTGDASGNNQDESCVEP